MEWDIDRNGKPEWKSNRESIRGMKVQMAQGKTGRCKYER
jgi:hypothetical protein